MTWSSMDSTGSASLIRWSRMAEILIKAVDAHHPDPAVDERGCYKRGYPVVVMPDGHQWGSAEGLPTFYVIKLPTVTVEQVQKYIDQWMDPLVPTEVKRRREWTVDVDLLPTDVLNTLVTTGTITVSFPGYNGPSDISWNQARNRFRNMRTGLTE
jgi:hypothetical protein